MEGEDTHLGDTTCALCRQTARDLSDIAISTGEPQRILQTCQKSTCFYCSKRPSQNIWCHKLCYDILVTTYEASHKPTPDDFEQLGRAIKPLYRPSTVDKHGVSSTMEEGLFSVYAEKLMEDRFRQGLLRKLPREILIMILDYVGTCPPLIVLGETRRLMDYLRNNVGECSVRFSLGKPLYANKISFDGFSYISKISDEPFPSAEILPQPPHITKIILSKDHVGIRNIRFLDAASEASTDGAQWYETMELPTGLSHPFVKISMNRLLVRSLQLFPIQEASQTTDWDTPVPPKLQPWNVYDAIPLPRHHDRLHYLPLNIPFTGITVCCRNAMAVGIYIHRGDMNAYNKFTHTMTLQYDTKPLFWIFFPIRDGESLSNIWVRTFTGVQTSRPVMMVRTTRSRILTFGPYIAMSQEGITLHPLLKESDGLISGLVFDKITKFGVICDSRQPPAISWSNSIPTDDRSHKPPLDRGTIGFSWYRTSASLVDVCKVQCCQDLKEIHCPIIGLLLHYQDGSSEALGQFRWDRQVSNILIPPIQFHYGKLHEKPYIRDVQAKSAEDDEFQANGSEWVNLSGHRAIWWFGTQGDQLVIE